MLYDCNLSKLWALRDAFPTIEIECYIQKPVETKNLVRKIMAKLEW
jgi:hypothetical protein